MNEKQARHAVDKALREDDPVGFADALMEAVDCSDDDRYARLPPLLKAAVAVNAFSLEMTSGGVQQLIANMAPSLLADVEEGLDLIGAREARKLVSDVRSRFPNGAVPGDEEARSRQLDG